MLLAGIAFGGYWHLSPIIVLVIDVLGGVHAVARAWN